ncbi:hypothetical protein CLOSBL3_12511 [Clostridiaceae bacterium BL-3]|nr:hypothetical protein CLOSBL3_12511 [Clostridiaceae bacterium BL-3]
MILIYNIKEGIFRMSSLYSSSLKIMTKYIIDRFLPYTGHSPEYVKLTGK